MKKLVSLFSGCGGMDLGFEQAGFKTVFATDINEQAAKVWRKNFNQDWAYHVGDIKDVINSRVFYEIAAQDIHVLTGGFPCQDFSVSGKRKGLESERGNLYKYMIKAVEIVQPRFVVAENVKGILTIPNAIERIIDGFNDIGYQMIFKVLNAKYFGVAQNRERVIFIGSKTPVSISFKESDFVPNAMDVLHGLQEPGLSSDADQNAVSGAKFLSEKCQGQTEIPKRGPAITVRANHHGNIEFRRLSREHGGEHRAELICGLPERRLTVRECARLQSFPDWFEFVSNGVSATAAYRMIGNAVPPNLARAIAEGLKYD